MSFNFIPSFFDLPYRLERLYNIDHVLLMTNALQIHYRKELTK